MFTLLQNTYVHKHIVYIYIYIIKKWALSYCNFDHQDVDHTNKLVERYVYKHAYLRKHMHTESYIITKNTNMYCIYGMSIYAHGEL